MRAGKTYADAFGAVGGAADEGEHWADFGAVLDAEQDTLQPTHLPEGWHADHRRPAPAETSTPGPGVAGGLGGHG